ncbi:phenylalanine--tRNA ligase subunit beta [Oceanivirga miroungae]|uniref:Phenylalanine--tRNA ligase beta subunit n=1 Tax=Oceanivirga miroungae TaxID=1130046 RepID=A0A6I8MF96_9FUSO|nr:phenylalanine--tRNA ligase subunit beta [Oceanivirga miroungae]VWL85967.1 phenylalanyl-tRNA synthetase subunit beta [Oceanivirga miroungae]
MLISLNWLNEYIEIKDKSISELENALTMIGQEVEKIEKKYEHLNKVLTAKIVEYEKMPESDHLTVLKVDNGKETLQVICGAPNHKKGDIVAMAQIGATLGEDFVIKKGKIRGYESNGMLCSMSELGIGEESDGIIIFPEDTQLGVPLNKLLDKDDVVFELEITPNRPDCLSYIGIARELSAYYNIPLKEIKKDVSEIDKKNDTEIKIDSSELSHRFITRIIEGVEVKKSPEWLSKKLEAIGMKSVNNIVDASNYILMELGQPNHVYDLDKIDKNISVKYATKGQKINTLDDKSLELDTDDIIVSSNGNAIALAGVMGSKDYSVTNETKNIMLEVAHFDSMSVRKTSRKYNIISESSYRFERRVDEDNFNTVIDRLANIIVEISGGKVLKGIKDTTLVNDKLNSSELSFERLNRFVGKLIEKERVIEILKSLEIEVEDKGESLILTPPSFRQDLLDEQDYFEEIIRIYGFANIENVLPKLDIKKEEIVDTTKLDYFVKNICYSLGLNEVINYSFIPKNAYEMIKREYKNIIEISNPITEDFAVMRDTLMYSLLKNAKDNFNRSFKDIRFFELSKVFNNENGNNNETKKLGVILAGAKEKTIHNKETSYDFYDIKGIMEEVAEKLSLNSYRILRSENMSFHPGRSIDVLMGKDVIASLGEVHPDLLENFNLEGKSILYFEFDLDKAKKYMKNKFVYNKISKYQSVNRDLAVVVNKGVLVGDVVKQVERIDKLVKKVELFDIYEGEGIESGKKSFAINILMRDDNKTLEEKEINAVMDKIVKKLEKDYLAKIR